MKRFFLLLLAAIIGLLPLMSACAEAPALKRRWTGIPALMSCPPSTQSTIRLSFST